MPCAASVSAPPSGFRWKHRLEGLRVFQDPKVTELPMAPYSRLRVVKRIFPRGWGASHARTVAVEAGREIVNHPEKGLLHPVELRT
jgi:hypothetical protein